MVACTIIRSPLSAKKKTRTKMTTAESSRTIHR
jgi:hypothetical protein